MLSTPYLVVSDNDEVVNVGNRILMEGQYILRGFSPGLVTGTQFATAVWLASGIGSLKIPRSRLLANCAAIVDANAAIYRRIRDFLANVSDRDVAEFEAMITDDRTALLVAGGFVAQPSLITEATSVAALTEIKESIREEERVRFEEELENRNKKYDQELDSLKARLGESNEVSSKLEQVIEDLSDKNKKKVARISEKYLSIEASHRELVEKLEKERKRKFFPVYFLILSVIAFSVGQGLGVVSFSFDQDKLFLGIQMAEGWWFVIYSALSLLFAFILGRFGSKVF